MTVGGVVLRGATRRVCYLSLRGGRKARRGNLKKHLTRLPRPLAWPRNDHGGRDCHGHWRGLAMTIGGEIATGGRAVLAMTSVGAGPAMAYGQFLRGATHSARAALRGTGAFSIEANLRIQLTTFCGVPLRNARIFCARMRSRRRRVSSGAQAICGVIKQFGALRSGLSASIGSQPATSAP